ncbi:HAUS augmin-like complex subunit 8 [Osmerus mordax]|uniref:HAUS augmin-like complex subunit 8 n=1 Tax=Osmerus mordax TaxID=8014 RepID=UPI00351068DD
MASRRVSFVPRSQKPTSSDAKGSKIGSENKTNGGASKKTKSGGVTIVKSRYLQSVDKTLSKSNSLTNESVFVPPRPASPKVGGVKPRVSTPPRQSLAPQSLPASMMPNILEPSLLGKSILQSTILDGHCLRPDFEMSAIREKTVLASAAEPEKNVEQEKKMLEMQTLLLTYLTAKMEHNTRKLKAEAEGRILAVMEEEEQLRQQVQEKKRQHLLLENNKQTHQLLDLQIAALTPVADAAQHFTEEYRSFATAVDTTRHELPVKNLHIEGDRREFLVRAEACLKDSEEVLLQCTLGAQQDDQASVESLKEMKTAAREISKQLTGGFSELLELSSLVSRHTVQIQQSLEEEQLGFTRAQELYCPKH